MRRETLKFTGKFCRKGFSMVEISVALVLAAIIIAGALYFVFKVGRTTEIDLAKSELREKVQTALRRLELDFYSAVRVSENMANHLPGIARVNLDGSLADPRGDVNENDILSMFILKNKELAVPLRNVTIHENFSGPQDVLVGLFKVTAVDAPPGTSSTDPSAVLAWNAQRYMHEAIRTHRYFLVSNSKNSLVLEREGGVMNPNANGNVAIHLRLPEDNSFTAADFADLPRISTLQRVTYYLSNNNLMRRSESRIASSGSQHPFETEIILENVTNFQMNYLFADRRHTRDVEPLTLPTIPLSHPAEFHGTEPRLGWADISAITGRLRTFSNQDFGDSSDAFESDQSFELSGNRLFYNIRFTSNPVAFEAMLQNSQNLEYDNCHPNDIENSRCNPACVNIFDSDDRSSPRWRGYGQHIGTANPSDYCLCGQDPQSGEFLAPESSAGFNAVPAWRQAESQANKNRTYACVREFASCSNNWRNKDVRVRLACGCTHSPEAYVGESILRAWAPAAQVPPGAAWAELASVLGTLDSNYPPSSPPPDEADVLKCRIWQSCGQWAQSWHNGGETWTNNTNGGDPRGGFGTYCQCNTHEVDAEGDITGTSVQEKNYELLCNPTQCPMLYADPPGSPPAYKLLNEDVAAGTGHALSLLEATLCECRKLTVPVVHSRQDFRRAGSFPQVPGGANPGSGAVDTYRVDVHREGDPPYEDRSCTEAQCRTSGSDMLSCCASERLTGGSLNAWNNAMSGSPYQATHSGYCHGRCQDVEDAWQTRRALFGVSTNAEVPSFCQGPTGGSGTNVDPMQ